MDRRDALKSTGLLVGGILSASTISLIQSCSNPPKPGWSPVYFSNDQILFLAELGETILPATDTPGAKEAGVERYIDSVVGEVFEEEEREIFTTSLQTFSNKVNEKYTKPFVECSQEERYESTVELMSTQEDFGRTLKLLVVTGFFKSEAGATKVLDFVEVPGRWEACIPLNPDQKTWAL